MAFEIRDLSHEGALQPPSLTCNKLKAQDIVIMLLAGTVFGILGGFFASFMAPTAFAITATIGLCASLGMLISLVTLKIIDRCKSSEYTDCNVTKQDPEIKQLEAGLLKDIVKLKKENQKFAEAVNELRQFLESDEELLSLYVQCVDQTKDILLPPAVMDNGNSVNNPLAEEWRIENQKNSHYLSLQTRFRDFLSKNPEFSTLFNKRYNKTKVDIATHANEFLITVKKKSTDSNFNP